MIKTYHGVAVKQRKIHLIFGASGFVGRHLAQYLAARGKSVVGTVCHSAEHSRLIEGVKLVRCDVTKGKSVERILRHYQPAYVYFLSALSSVRQSWINPVSVMTVNCLGGIHVLEAARHLGLKTKLLFFSSGTVYGASYLKHPKITEGTCLLPQDPYSVSKAALDYFVHMYAKVFHVSSLSVRFANLVGSDQTTRFSLSNFACQIARMEKGRQPRLMRVGNLKARRDFLDVRDGVRAIALVMRQGRAGEVYHIGCGKARSLQSVLQQMLRFSKFGAYRIKISVDTSMISKDEIPAMTLDVSKLKRLTGWQPQIPFRQTLLDLLDHFRSVS